MGAMNFFGTPNIGLSLPIPYNPYVTAASVQLGTGPVSLGIAPGVNGTQIDEIVFIGQGASVAADYINIFINSGGTTYWLWDQVAVPASANTAASGQWRQSVLYENLILPDPSYSLCASVMVPANSRLLIGMAMGGDG